jgi:hypothetical protein
MGQFKQTVYLVDGRNNGWSYSLFIQPTRDVLDPNANGMNDFAKALMPLMGTGVLVTYNRESIRNRPKVSILGTFNANNTQWQGDPAKPIEQAGSVILLQCYNTDFSKKKNLFMHGVWDTAITNKSVQTPPGWAALRDNFIKELTTGKYYFLGKVGVKKSLIAAVAPAPANKLLITTQDPFFDAPFDGSKRVEVTIKGVESVPDLPKPVLVSPTSATTAVTKNRFLGALNHAGSISMNSYDLIQIKQAFMTRATTHRIGRPFNPAAGGRYKRTH